MGVTEFLRVQDVSRRIKVELPRRVTEVGAFFDEFGVPMGGRLDWVYVHTVGQQIPEKCFREL